MCNDKEVEREAKFSDCCRSFFEGVSCCELISLGRLMETVIYHQNPTPNRGKQGLLDTFKINFSAYSS